jgi:hypothetical protein
MVVGFIGFAVKHNIDRLVATVLFHRKWELLNYWSPLNTAVRVTQLSRSEARFLATMVAISLPFVWIGVAMTIKRLRSAGLPLSLILLFFVPFLNLAFFLLLCLIPERVSLTENTATSHIRSSRLAAIVPESASGSALFSPLFTVPAGLAFVTIGTRFLVNYGWGLFVAIPFTMGFAAALSYGIHQPRSLAGCIGVACLSNVLLGLALLAFAFEGIICFILAMPIALPLACFGGVFGYLLQRWRWFQSGAPAFLSALLLVVPGIQDVEHLAAPTPPVYIVCSAINIQAPPEKVWRQVVAFSEIAPPREWIFRAGIAYPIRAEIIGSGPAAERHCVFSTGAFVEPIQIWDRTADSSY